jgi:hypothetical protein
MQLCHCITNTIQLDNVMSIFRNTFTDTVRTQLKLRQNTAKSRTPQSIQLTNSRAPWVRMTSAVDTFNETKKVFDSTLANQYILLGGVLDSNKQLKYSVGSTGNEAYSNQTPSGDTYQRGPRPMPGITSVDVKSKSAYGSLREVTVNFICHDIKQLEDLEVLYMRPGYTVLVEWGWLPYLNNDGSVVTNVDFYDDVLNGKTDFQTALTDLFAKSKTHSGNYDAVYGKVQNYSWQARMDGGYDCTTTIITIGEVLESIKVNTTPFNINKIVNDKGVLFKPKSVTNLQDFYSQNYLAGLLYEFQQYLYELKKSSSKDTVANFYPDVKYKTDYYYWVMDYDTKSNQAVKENTTTKAYITLESLLNLINNYIIIGAGKQDKLLPFTKLSTYSNTYETETPEPLLCLSHPLQVSVDAEVCVITNSLFANGLDIVAPQVNLGSENGSAGTYDGVAADVYKNISSFGIANPIGLNDQIKIAQTILNAINIQLPSNRPYAEQNTNQFLASYLKYSNNTVLNLKRAFDVLIKESNDDGYKEAVKIVSNTLSDPTNADTLVKTNAEKEQTAKALASGEPFPIKKVNYLSLMESVSSTYIKKYQSAEKGDYGVVGNIYINLAKAIELATNFNSTTSEKKEIKLYDFIKSILREVQESTGNLNNFDIHIDPIDSIARIIDINYVDKMDRITAYNKAFPLEIANTSGVVRSYTLQSQIFPEQSSIVAIGAQVKAGGEQGADNNTLLDFNKGIQDRIMPVKLDQNDNSITKVSDEEKMIELVGNIKILQEYFFPPKSPAVKTSEGANVEESRKYKNALKDTIKYVQSVTDANSKNRSIIPIKVSLTMDGIGGLIIGHLFKFPDELLPQGYKFTSNDKGVKLLQTIIGLSHKIDNNGWTTTLDAYNMVLNNPQGIKWSSLISKNPTTGASTLFIPNTTLPVSTKDFSKDKIAIAIRFFKGKNYSDVQVSAIVGGLLQESGLNPTLTNSKGAYGIAQWLDDRLVALKKFKSNFNTFQTQLEFLYYELSSSAESRANALLVKATTLENAIVAFAAFERYAGINVRDGVTFEEVAVARDTGRRIGYARDIYNRIQAKEF